MAFLSSSQMAEMTNPKHIPHSPCRIVRMITRMISPWHCTLNTRIMKINTKVV
nr:unnamed protein product [Callosobruchus analis]